MTDDRRRQRRVNFLSRPEVERVISSTETVRNKALLSLIYQLGLRRGEVRFLRRRDFRENSSRYGSIVVWRLKRGDLMPNESPLWKRTSDLLKAYLRTRMDDSDALFLSQKGLPLGPQAVYYIFKRAATKAGIDRSRRHPHSLRHSIATHHSNMGTNIEDIMDLLGHKSVNSTMIYAQVLNPRKEEITIRSENSQSFARF